MEPIRISPSQAFIYVALAGAAIGLLLGLVPLVLGRRRGQARLGVYGFIASIVAGAVAPLLAVIVTAIFTWMIVKKRSEPSEPAPPIDDTTTEA
ncbi:MAG: hypothetical protein ABR535_08270 [Pyrinomonadaceae bacterium]